MPFPVCLLFRTRYGRESQTLTAHFLHAMPKAKSVSKVKAKKVVAKKPSPKKSASKRTLPKKTATKTPAFKVGDKVTWTHRSVAKGTKGKVLVCTGTIEDLRMKAFGTNPKRATATIRVATKAYIASAHREHANVTLHHLKKA